MMKEFKVGDEFYLKCRVSKILNSGHLNVEICINDSFMYLFSPTEMTSIIENQPNLIKEDEKPTIPSFVVKHIEQHKDLTAHEFLNWVDENRTTEQELYKWVYHNDFKEGFKNQEAVFAYFIYGKEFVKIERKYRVYLLDTILIQDSIKNIYFGEEENYDNEEIKTSFTYEELVDLGFDEVFTSSVFTAVEV